MSKVYYAGIGSRSALEMQLQLMRELAGTLAHKGYVLRSGAADGCDTAFEAGCDEEMGEKEIYLPWMDFNHHKSQFTEATPEAKEMAATFHPRWKYLSQGAQKLHARNCHQVLGYDLNTPVSFVLCWTPNGAFSGGTAQALRIALSRDIPIINLGTGIGYGQALNLISEIVGDSR